MKGLSPLISTVLLILIAFFIALAVNSWARETVVEMLNDSYNNYKKTVGAFVGSFFDFFR